MVMEISVEHLKDELSSKEYDTYRVYVEDHRILATLVHSEHAAGKWLKAAPKLQNTKLRDTVVVGVIADHDLSLGHLDRDLRPYNLIRICIGCHCLLYFLPWKFKPTETGLKFMNSFFSQRKVFAVGTNMKTVAKNLERDFHVRVENPRDLNELAAKGMNRDDLDLRRYNLEQLAKVVLGKRFDVERPYSYIKWHHHSWRPSHEELTTEKVKFATVDAHFCFLMGSQLLETIHLKKNNEKKKKKKRVSRE